MLSATIVAGVDSALGLGSTLVTMARLLGEGAGPAESLTRVKGGMFGGLTVRFAIESAGVPNLRAAACIDTTGCPFKVVFGRNGSGRCDRDFAEISVGRSVGISIIELGRDPVVWRGMDMLCGLPAEVIPVRTKTDLASERLTSVDVVLDDLLLPASTEALPLSDTAGIFVATFSVGGSLVILCEIAVDGGKVVAVLETYPLASADAREATAGAFDLESLFVRYTLVKLLAGEMFCFIPLGDLGMNKSSGRSKPERLRDRLRDFPATAGMIDAKECPEGDAGNVCLIGAGPRLVADSARGRNESGKKVSSRPNAELIMSTTCEYLCESNLQIYPLQCFISM